MHKTGPGRLLGPMKRRPTWLRTLLYGSGPKHPCNHFILADELYLNRLPVPVFYRESSAQFLAAAGVDPVIGLLRLWYSGCGGVTSTSTRLGRNRGHIPPLRSALVYCGWLCAVSILFAGYILWKTANAIRKDNEGHQAALWPDRAARKPSRAM